MQSGTALPGVDQYTTMGALIAGWREAWGQGEFPFLYVQKPSGGGTAWDYSNPVTRMADPFVEISEGTTLRRNTGRAAYRAHHVGMMNHKGTALVSVSDLGSGVHPRNKSGYGRRACDVALGFCYGRDVEIYGPIYKSHKIEGDKIRVAYDHIGKGLASRHGNRLQGFEIAGDDLQWHWADATIDGATIVCTSSEVKTPQHVRYAWDGAHPWANLFNKDGMPALIFTTEK